MKKPGRHHCYVCKPARVKTTTVESLGHESYCSMLETGHCSCPRNRDEVTAALAEATKELGVVEECRLRVQRLEQELAAVTEKYERHYEHRTTLSAVALTVHEMTKKERDQALARVAKLEETLMDLATEAANAGSGLDSNWVKWRARQALKGEGNGSVQTFKSKV